MHVDTSGESADSSEEDTPRRDPEKLRWKKKYMLLLKRTENVEKQNMRLINRIYQVKSITKRLKTEKRFLVRRLDRHRDNFRGAKIFTDVELLPEGTSDANNRTQKHPNGDGEDEEMPNEKALLGLPPKKPMSAFFRYCQAQHLQILQKNSAMPHDAIKKSLAEKWTTMPHAQKNKYFTQYQEEQNVYESEMNDFLDNFQENAENTCNSLIKQEPEEEEESIIEEEEEMEEEEADGEDNEDNDDEEENGEDAEDDEDDDNDDDDDDDDDDDNDNDDDDEEEVEEEEEEVINEVSHNDRGGKPNSDESNSDDDADDDDDDNDEQNRNGETNVEHADNGSLNSSSSLSEQGSLSSDDQDENG